MKILFFLFFVAMLLANAPGCATHHTSGAQDARVLWARGWISASHQLFLKDAYQDMSAESANRQRGKVFNKFVLYLHFEMSARPLSGSQVLDLLGNPDRILSGNVATLLSYDFVEEPNRRKRTATIVVGTDGMAQKVVFN